MDSWLSGRVSALQSVVAGLISSGGDHGIHCWWVLSYVMHLTLFIAQLAGAVEYTDSISAEC